MFSSVVTELLPPLQVRIQRHKLNFSVKINSEIERFLIEVFSLGFYFVIIRINIKVYKDE